MKPMIAASQLGHSNATLDLRNYGKYAPDVVERRSLERYCESSSTTASPDARLHSATLTPPKRRAGRPEVVAR